MKKINIYFSEIVLTLMAIFITVAILISNKTVIKTNKIATPYFNSASSATNSMDPYTIKEELKNMKAFLDKNTTTLDSWSDEIENAINIADYLVSIKESGSDNLMVETNAFVEKLETQEFMNDKVKLHSALGNHLSILADGGVFGLTLILFCMGVAAIIMWSFNCDFVLVSIPLSNIVEEVES